MDAIADLMDAYSVGEIRVTHEQNLVLPHVKQKDLPAIFAALQAVDLATPNAGLITDIIACPGLDYCDLANARSIPIAQSIARKFADLDRQHDIGELKIKISGCINACGHHHAGHIGILGVDKKGVEFYQLQLGGSGAEDASIGDIMGPGFGEHEIAGAVERVVDHYVKVRKDGERFLDTYRRIGMEPFKDAAYEQEQKRRRDQTPQEWRLSPRTAYAPWPMTPHCPTAAAASSFRWRVSRRSATRCWRATPRWACACKPVNRRNCWARM